MFLTTDTIVAIATPPGRGGIGVVRLSGPEAHAMARKLIAREEPLVPRHATLARVMLVSPAGSQPHASQPHASQPYASQPYVPSQPYVVSGFSRTPQIAIRTATDAIDEVIATYFPAPHSYTGDDVVEVSAHGSPVVLRTIVSAAVDAGARLAEPGEFTLRAYLNGRMDLMQAEAVADLIDAVTPLQARAAFDQLQGTLTGTINGIDASLFDLIARLEASVDFPEEGYHFVEPGALVVAIDALVARTKSLLRDARRGRLVREGLQIAIVGKPNVGKSSLFNALVGSARAIVTDVPGTTRDLVTEVVDFDGVRVTLVDTAGLRSTTDIVETEGVDRARRAQNVAELILVVLDASEPLDDADRDVLLQTSDNKRLIVENKADLKKGTGVFSLASGEAVVSVSALTGAGLDCVRRQIVAALDIEALTDPPAITNVRHIALVERAQQALERARTAAGADGGTLSEEFVLADLQDARMALEEVSGRRASDDLLAHIFSRFCIGK